LGRKKTSKSKKTIATLHPNPISRNMGLFMAIFGAILYLNTLHHGYVLDDYSVIKANWVIQKGLDGIQIIWETPYRFGYWNNGSSLYRPITLSIFAIEWAIAPDNPTFGHFINILFYALLGFMLFKLLARLLHNHPPVIAIIATLLFMAYPPHTEVVANIKSLDELLASFFSITAIYLLIKYYDSRKRRFIYFSLVLYLISIFSKESAITFLALIPLILWYFTDFKIKNILIVTATYLIPVFIYLLSRHSVLDSTTSIASVSVLDNMLVGINNSFDKLATEIYLLGKYIWMTIFPYHLSSDYSFNQIPSTTFKDWKVWLSLMLYLAMIIFILKTWRKKNLFSFALLWYLIGLGLYSNLFITIGTHFADRFHFVSSLGFCLIVPAILIKILDYRSFTTKELSIKLLLKYHKISFAFIAFILITYCFKTISRNNDWKSNYTLFSSDVLNSPNSARIHFGLGLEFMQTKALKAINEESKQIYLDSSINEFTTAVSIYSNYSEAFEQIGLAFYRKGNNRKAVENYNKALTINPYSPTTYSNLGAIYFGNGNYQKALEVYRQAIKYNPRYADAYLNLGSTLAVIGKTNEAIDAFKKGLQYDPNNPQINRLLGITYKNIGDKQNADFYLNKARLLGAN